MKMGFRSSIVIFVLAVLPASIAFARTSTPTKTTKRDGKVAESARAKKHMSRMRRRHHYYEHFYTSSFADGVATGDITAGEDPVVRQAAIDASRRLAADALAGVGK